MSVGGRGGTRWVAGAALSALAALLLLASPGRSQDAKPGPEALRGLVRELLALRGEAAEEENRWREEKSHLETTLSLLEKERDALREKLDSVKETEDSAGEERARLAGRIESAEGLLVGLDGEVRRTAERLLAVHASLPEPLREKLSGAAARVGDLLALEPSPGRANDHLRLVNAFSADLDRVLGDAHAVKQVLRVDGGDPREYDVLYLGGAVGYFVGPGGREAGLLVRRGTEWEVLRRDGIAAAVRRAIEIVGKTKPAEVVLLPLPGGER